MQPQELRASLWPFAAGHTSSRTPLALWSWQLERSTIISTSRSRNISISSFEDIPSRDRLPESNADTIKTGNCVDTWKSTASHQVQAMRRGQTGTHPVRVQDLALGEEIGVVREMGSVPHTVTSTGIDRFLARDTYSLMSHNPHNPHHCYCCCSPCRGVGRTLPRGSAGVSATRTIEAIVGLLVRGVGA